MKKSTAIALTCVLLLVAYVAGFSSGGGDNAIDDDFPNIDDMVVTTTEAPQEYQAWLQKSVESYLRASNLPAMSELTTCFYFEPTSKLTFHEQWLISIASPGDFNGFLLGFRHEYFRLHSCQDETDGNNLGRGEDALAAFKEAHRHCFVYDATTLKWYYDKNTPGVLELVTTSNHDGGCEIKTGASLVPLNDQDSVGGGLKEEQQVPGLLADLQVWDRALSDSEITQDLGCQAQGNVVKFEDLEVVGEDNFQPSNFKCSEN